MGHPPKGDREAVALRSPSFLGRMLRGLSSETGRAKRGAGTRRSPMCRVGRLDPSEEGAAVLDTSSVLQNKRLSLGCLYWVTET
jgi:hypothetical protein